MDSFFEKILRISGLSDDEIEKFKNTYFKILGARILAAIASIDADAHEKLEAILSSDKANKDELTNTLKQISLNPDVKKEITKVVNETTEEFVETITVNITDQEKQRIIAALQ